MWPICKGCHWNGENGCPKWDEPFHCTRNLIKVGGKDVSNYKDRLKEAVGRVNKKIKMQELSLLRKKRNMHLSRSNESSKQ